MIVVNKRDNRTFQLLLHLCFIAFSICFIIPLWAIVAVSISNESEIGKLGYSLIPKSIDFTAYKYILKNPKNILDAYKVTIIMSGAGAFLYLVMASMCAYPLSRASFKYRRGITFYLFFTMLLNGGLVPFYILMTKYLGLKNTYAALIIPLLGNVWYLFFMRTFFQQLPVSIIESATIDGASELKIYFVMMLPLSKPVIATVGLLQLLAFWNSWYPALLFVTKETMYPLQYLLQVILRNIAEILKNMQMNVPAASGQLGQIPSESTRMAMCILAVGPMLFIFPFFQKYFTQGLTVGSVKG